MLDRATYAFLGFCFGAVFGLVGCLVHGQVFAGSAPGSLLDPRLRAWMLSMGAVFALLGFVLKDRFASALGEAFASLLGSRAGQQQLSGGKAVLLIGFLAGVLWYVMR